MLMLVRLFLGGILKKLASLNVWQLLLIAALIFGGVQTIRVKTEQRHARKVEAQLSKTIAAREADRKAYSDAQAKAAELNKARVAAKEAESKRITDETQSAYARDRAELIRLRHQALKGAANGAGPPAPPAPAQGADADGLRLSPDEHLQASEIELRLMHLQNWVERQLGVDPNK